MARRGAAIRRFVIPDPVHNNHLLGRFINFVMREGKRTLATRIVYTALDIAVKKMGVSDPVGLFEEVLTKVGPPVEVKPKRVGGSVFRVPMEVDDHRRVTLAMRWVIAAARKRSEKNMIQRLAHEFLDVLHDRGGAVRKREEVEKDAAFNQAFSHFRF